MLLTILKQNFENKIKEHSTKVEYNGGSGGEARYVFEYFQKNGAWLPSYPLCFSEIRDKGGVAKRDLC